MSADLIAKLERATGRDPELNRAIDEFDVRSRGKLAPDKPFCVEVSPDFTGSLDAALTLLPTWASFELTQSAAGPPTFTRCRLWDWRRSPTGFDPANEWKSEGNRPLALNVCIAALRAVAA